ncbi:glucosamine-6-phosphate deaminase [Segetibacter koreensis]|uniref:glucosamine-6-phosphate deaminase n=1 Tax=Segetibacter koreensis TaxID=398037 RepID=UPI0003696400|nr:glucosamine-6-phosphate deaminase [Segetibacter koreensis]
MSPIKELTANKLKVRIYETRLQMGADAAKDACKKIKELLLKQGFVNIIFAAAPSQNEFLASLAQEEGVDWSRVNAFHMDEYVGLERNAPQRFARFLKEKIFSKVSFNEVHYINGSADDTGMECRRYSNLLKQYPADIVCIGIGENTHIAFNDPHTADFNDPLVVKEVTLDTVSREQQVHDGCFATIEDVPTSAITLTVPALFSAESIYCIVPGNKKADAVYHTLNSEVKAHYPSTVLRKHSNATLYLDQDSAKNL